MRFFIYSRKSVYTGKGESIENQIEMCREYIRQRHPNAAENEITVYEDEGYTGANTKRPQFQKMIRDIKIQKPDFVVCYRLDRISRSVRDFSSLIEELNDRDISFVSIKEQFDTSNPMSRTMMYITSAFGQLERETIAERVRDNMLMLARTGRWLGGVAPTGFTAERKESVIIDGKVKSSSMLVDVPDELIAVDTIFEKYLELRSIVGVNKYLIRAGIKNRKGTHYTTLGIKDILKNPVYCIADEAAFEYFSENGADVAFALENCSNEFGLTAYNKRDYTKKHAPRQSIEKWIIAIGKHKGRIAGEKWVAIQNILVDNIPTGAKPAKMHNDYALLSGLIYCEKCGSRMFAKKRKGKGENEDTYLYMCESKMRGGTVICDCPNISGAQADAIVCEYLINYVDEKSDISQMLGDLENRVGKKVKGSPLAALGSQIKKREEEIERLIFSLSQTNLEPAFINRVNVRVASLDREINELKSERLKLQQDVSILSDKSVQIEMLKEALKTLRNHFAELSVYEKRALIKLMVKKIAYDGKDLHIFCNGE